MQFVSSVSGVNAVIIAINARANILLQDERFVVFVFRGFSAFVSMNLGVNFLRLLANYQKTDQTFQTPPLFALRHVGRVKFLSLLAKDNKIVSGDFNLQFHASQ